MFGMEEGEGGVCGVGIMMMANKIDTVAIEIRHHHNTAAETESTIEKLDNTGNTSSNSRSVVNLATEYLILFTTQNCRITSFITM
jgi:hypothetical protein